MLQNLEKERQWYKKGEINYCIILKISPVPIFAKKSNVAINMAENRHAEQMAKIEEISPTKKKIFSSYIGYFIHSDSGPLQFYS